MDPVAMSALNYAWSSGGYVRRWCCLASSIPARTPMAVAAPTAPYGDRLARSRVRAAKVPASRRISAVMSPATQRAKQAAAAAFAENLSTVDMSNMGVLLPMPGLDARNRVHFHHVGALRRTRSAADAGLIGRGVPCVRKIEIILQVPVSADKQE
jgi:hypothetical protein